MKYISNNIEKTNKTLLIVILNAMILTTILIIFLNVKNIQLNNKIMKYLRGKCFSKNNFVVVNKYLYDFIFY